MLFYRSLLETVHTSVREDDLEETIRSLKRSVNISQVNTPFKWHYCSLKVDYTIF